MRLREEGDGKRETKFSSPSETQQFQGGPVSQPDIERRLPNPQVWASISPANKFDEDDLDKNSSGASRHEEQKCPFRRD
jgi:hypothetical protein